MKKSIILTLTFCAVVTLTLAAGCVGGADPLVGTWQAGDKNSVAIVYTFNSDGSGTYITFMGGRESVNQEISWKKVSDGKYSVSSSGSQKTITLRSGILFDGGREYIKA